MDLKKKKLLICPIPKFMKMWEETMITFIIGPEQLYFSSLKNAVLPWMSENQLTGGGLWEGS